LAGQAGCRVTANDTIFGPGTGVVLDFGVDDFVGVPFPLPVSPAPPLLPVPRSPARPLVVGEALVPGRPPDAVVLFALHAAAIRTSVLAAARTAARIAGWFVMRSTVGIAWPQAYHGFVPRSVSYSPGTRTGRWVPAGLVPAGRAPPGRDPAGLVPANRQDAPKELSTTAVPPIRL
jgi:hypothetical protein